MTIERVNPDSRANIHSRPAPRCYSRQPFCQAIQPSREEADSGSIVIALSITTCVAAFLVVSGGWSF